MIANDSVRYLVRVGPVVRDPDIHKAARIVTSAFSDDCLRVLGVFDHMREMLRENS